MNRPQLERELTERLKREPELRKRLQSEPQAVIREFCPACPDYLTVEVGEDLVQLVAPPSPCLEPKPAYFEPSEFDFLDVLRPSFSEMRKEALGVIQEMQRLDWVYPELFRRDSLLDGGSRARFMLWFVGMRLKTNMDRCPRAAELCWSIPGLVSAGFYLLGPQTKMLSHVGTRSDILRCHFGLVVPPNCALKVAGEERAWQEGEFLVFDDTHPHEAWNESDQYRCVFHLDFYHKPMSDVQRAASTRVFREKLLHSAPGFHPWLLAAGVQTDGDHQKWLEEQVDPDSEQARTASTLSKVHGVFL